MAGLRRAAGAGVLGALLALACRVPREVHEPREYPSVKLSSREITAVVVDSRPPATDPTERKLALPSSFERKVQARLTALASGTGPALGVIVTFAAADELPIVDARGEMVRVRVRLEFEIKLPSGLVLRRAEAESTSDLPPDEATPEEIAYVLDATAIDAFDRYFADAAVLSSLNRELAGRSAIE